MTSKIFRSVFFTSILVLIACLTLIVGVLRGFFENQIKNELASEAEYVSYAIENDAEGFFQNFSSSKNRITLISPDGTVIGDTDADAKKLGNHSDRAEFREALEKGTGSSVRYSDTFMEKTVYYAKKLNDGRVLRVSTTQYTTVTIMLGLLQPALVIVFISLILSLFLSSLVSKSIVKPINNIDLDNPENSDAYEELSPLLHKIIKQKKTIAKQISDADRMRGEFRLITENMNEGFLVIDKNANLLSCNTSALRLLGTEEISGNVLKLNRTGSFIDAVRAALEGCRAENTMLHDGRTYTLIANPVMTDGKTAGAVIVIIDITESAKREAMRREFTANVSHELKTPLTSISGFAELMKAGGLPESTVVDFSSSIYSEAQRLITLVCDIIKLSELDDGDVHSEPENVSLLSLAREIAERLRPSAERKNVLINVKGDDAKLIGVRQILDEMIYNLCDNAIKYNIENGRVDISVQNTDSGISLSVSDTGIGIPSAEQSRVFERFYRVDKSRSNAEGGTGLGLSIVKHAALYHNAEISLDSTPGKGTTVTVTFPRGKVS